MSHSPPNTCVLQIRLVTPQPARTHARRHSTHPMACAAAATASAAAVPAAAAAVAAAATAAVAVTATAAAAAARAGRHAAAPGTRHGFYGGFAWASHSHSIRFLTTDLSASATPIARTAFHCGDCCAPHSREKTENRQGKKKRRRRKHARGASHTKVRPDKTKTHSTHTLSLHTARMPTSGTCQAPRPRHRGPRRSSTRRRTSSR